MRYLWQHIGQILAWYDGTVPLHHYLKTYYKAAPKLCSRDRRGISDAVYASYLVGKAFSEDKHPQEQQILAAISLCGLQPKAFETVLEERGLIAEGTILQRHALLNRAGFLVDFAGVFPADIPFSEGILDVQWRMQLAEQPRLFLRIRNRQAKVDSIVRQAGIAHEWLTETCLALPNGTKVEELLPADCYVVQDASSQATGKYLQPGPSERWWDCCSGAGGKSLMLKDASSETHLLTTDLRQSILRNLKDRFRLYHHSLPEMAALNIADASATAQFMGDRRFDGIICDVPCTGSGTWARTPESCYYFNLDSIEEYAQRQKDILRNAATYLTEGGKIIYITCSVFRAENEDVIESIVAEGALKIKSAGLINGLSIGADALFAAELRRV